MTIFNRKIKKWYLEILTYCSLLIPGVFFLCFTGNKLAQEIFGRVIQNKDATASYLMLTSILVIFSYCICEEKLSSCLLLVSAGINFLVLFINKNIVSLWLMIGVFLWIPLLLRPTAKLIKRVMQLFFLYAFMLCNMSLLTMQTSFIQIKLTYDLEVSVYLELILALGALAFFRYWDRIPEGTELSKISLVKLQRKIAECLGLLILVFAGILLGGGYWNNLPDEGSRAVIKKIALSLVNEINTTESALLACINSAGIIVLIGIIALIYMLWRRVRRKYHPDKPITDMLIVLLMLFIVELLTWNLTWGNVVLYTIFFFFAYFMYEEKREVKIIQRSLEYEKENTDKDIGNDVFNDESVLVEDSVSACGRT